MAILGGDIGYKNDKGKVFCNRSILLSVINLATKEINGVAAMSNNFGEFRSLFGGKVYDGVKVDFEKDGIDIDLYLKVYSNISVPEVASKIQENVKNAVLSMLNVKIKSIDINVVGCVLAKEFQF